MLDYNFIYLSAVLILVGDSSYLLKTIRGKVRPNRVSWLLWGLTPIAVFFAQISKGVGPESYLTLVFGAVSFLIFAATYFNKKSVWRLTGFDMGCGIFSLIGLLLWQITKEGNLAIAFILIADSFATFPTIKKAYTNPETESVETYLLNAIAAFIGLLIIKEWNFASYAYLINSLFFCTLFVFLIKFKLGKKFA